MEEQDAFYVVRKGNIVAVYSTLKDCQDQVGHSICDPAVSVYKGYSLSTETESFLAAKGLKNALYTIDATDVKEDLFGALLPCQFQDVNKPSCTSVKHLSQDVTLGSSAKRELIYGNHHKVDVLPETQFVSEHHLNQGFSFEAEPISINYMECALDFSGCSKGNPVKSGAGAVLRTEDGTAVATLREGLGYVTNDVAAYKALIMGLKYALENGFKKIRVQGDSQLVCKQVQGIWKAVQYHNLIELCEEVKESREKFLSFEINYVQGEYIKFARVQAEKAIELPAGERCIDEGF